uniref:FTS and Hook-interacting protein-like n=1 Tax=Callorhinchus milii TaxID=7868 RepID=A0A4W3GIB2_CALMI
HVCVSPGHGSPSVDTSSVTAAVPKPSTPSRLAFFMRQQSPSSESGHGHRSPSLGSCDRPSLASPLHSPSKWEEVSELEANYLEYLQEARCNIDQCVRACRVWSAPYDGKRPDPSSFPPPPISDCGSISLCTDHFGCGRGAASPEGRRRPRREELENGDWDPQASHSGSTPRNNKRSAVLAHGLDPGQGHGKGQLNGTGGKDRTRPELRPVERGECCLLVKKVRRDSGAQSAAPQGRRREAAQDISKQRPAEEPETGQWEGAAGGQSVDSLIDELLEKAPAEHNGSHLNVESFTRELSDMEASMRQRARHQEPTDPPAHTLLPSDEEEEEEEEQGFSSPACAPQVPSHAQPIQSAHTQPFTGPFIAVLFAKLDNMLQNSLYVNFLLTGIIAQLACYPQPLLRSFLLNTNMVFQPTVKSLIQVGACVHITATPQLTAKH